MRHLPYTYMQQRQRSYFFSILGYLKRLVSKINALKTSLLPDVFVYHGKSRLGVMKCTVIDPEGATYEKTLFEFKFNCSAELTTVLLSHSKEQEVELPLST